MFYYAVPGNKRHQICTVLQLIFIVVDDIVLKCSDKEKKQMESRPHSGPYVIRPLFSMSRGHRARALLMRLAEVKTEECFERLATENDWRAFPGAPRTCRGLKARRAQVKSRHPVYRARDTASLLEDRVIRVKEKAEGNKERIKERERESERETHRQRGRERETEGESERQRKRGRGWKAKTCQQDLRGSRI